MAQLLVHTFFCGYSPHAVHALSTGFPRSKGVVPWYRIPTSTVDKRGQKMHSAWRTMRGSVDEKI